MLLKRELYNDEWEQLLRAGGRRRYLAGDVIYIQGKKNVGLVCITKGKAKNCIYYSDGTEKLVCILEGPAVTGETSVIDGEGSIVSTEALTELEAVIVPASVVKELMGKNPRIMMFLLELNAEKIRALQFQAENIVLTTRQKLARMLINFYSSGYIPGSRREIWLPLPMSSWQIFWGQPAPRLRGPLMNLKRAA
ncbi:Crp/Fnr family transcriptional regulator [Clostridium sp. AM58-1XD]|uniref:Crp/Fnr family transcriptional regulator n=1 Tax=Clostridium sp. AM58-1XD TaxID=2292307 RepID=UPI000E4F6147|nr:Crp/Fnr family transcriptional regulator [Clostridium sp. AM58-1XD]RGZ01195.1 Crp/Fnr family transcriptional regulator [Clostridium sp. AM58-1XD]